MTDTERNILDFTPIVLLEIPLIDVRAPVEHAAGSFPRSINLPIMDNEDRHQVGLCYRQHGREAAFSLGFRRVSGAIRSARIQAWVDYLCDQPQALLFCFRGGMRSKIAQQWIEEKTGLVVPRLSGGYKAFRRFLLGAMSPDNVSASPVLLGGRTGCGKTVLLRQLENAIDLEGAANHRGSAFGGFLTPQPSQIDFENRLAYQLVKHREQGFRYLVLEDEGAYIGSRYVPHELAGFFKRDTMVVLQLDRSRRIATIHSEYVVCAQEEYRRVFGEEGPARWYEDMRAKFKRIRKRLGGERCARLLGLLEQAYREQRTGGVTDSHYTWVEVLLREYYDPMYDYQIEKSGRKIAFKGEFSEVLAYLRELEGQ